MLASRIVRQMASGANKDPSKIKKENQRVLLGVAGLIGLTGLVYYAGFAAEGKRPNSYAEKKKNFWDDDAVIEEVAVIE